jgi:hypothetical protein
VSYRRGPRSLPERITVGKYGDVGIIRSCIVDPQVTKRNGTSVTLKWNLPDGFDRSKVVEYHITYWSEETDVLRTLHIDAENSPDSATVSGLSPGIDYFFYIIGHNKYGDGPSCQVITGTTSGTPLPRPWNVIVEQYGSGTEIRVSWSFADKTGEFKNKLWDCAVFYAIYEQDIDDYAIENFYNGKTSESTLKVVHVSVPSSKPSAMVTELLACEHYIFRVQIVGPTGYSRISEMAVINTGNDDQAPPKILGVHANRWTETMQVSWERPCRFDTEPLSYEVIVKELGGNHLTQGFPSNTSRDEKMDLTIHNLNRGATYQVKVVAHISGAKKSEPVEITFQPYGAPSDFKVLQIAEEIILIWELKYDMPNATDEPFKYDILHSVDHDAEHNGTWEIFKVVEQTKTVIKSLDPAEDHSFKVRLSNVDGYPGANSSIQTIYAPPTGKSATSHGNHGKSDSSSSTSISHGKKSLYVTLGVLGIAVIIGLVVVLLVFVIRHRRLQRSFLSFANSHYDIRSGTTTINTGDDLGEEEDSPMIVGFSDDEPLVIA